MLYNSSSSHISVIRKEIIRVQCNAVPKCKDMLQSNAVPTAKIQSRSRSFVNLTLLTGNIEWYTSLILLQVTQLHWMYSYS